MTFHLNIRQAGLVALALVGLAVLPATASARHGHRHHHTIAPPGNSGIGQYVESVPTAQGSRPTNTIHPHHGSHGGGGTGGGGGGAGGGQSGTAGGSTPLGGAGSSSAGQNAASAAASNLAQATAPGRQRTNHRNANGGGFGNTLTPAPAGKSPSSVSSVLSALTGSSSSGGLGLLLPGLLIIAFVGMAVLAVAHRRKAN